MGESLNPMLQGFGLPLLPVVAFRPNFDWPSKRGNNLLAKGKRRGKLPDNIIF